MKSFKTFCESVGDVKPVFMRDNPGGDWLKYKQEDAEKYHQRTNYIGGAVTANFRNLRIPTSDLVQLRGAMGEEKHRKPGGVKYDRLAADVDANGWDDAPIHQIYIGVNHRGEAFIGEGNHRSQVAHDKGISHIWAEVRYFNGGEQVPGPWHPDEVRKRYLST